MSTTTDETATESAPKWRPLPAIERRVLGVLIEKAKTTPENYPLSINALRAGCNQKSNRAPSMQLEEDKIEEALEELRRVGAVSLVQGGSRIDRFRHLAYEWLGVDKTELAVMAELLLRGAQTVGELRGRAARMEPIADLSALRPILDSLQAKQLLFYLTPPGRGAVVTHALYLDREMDKLKRETSTWPAQEPSNDSPNSQDDAPTIAQVPPARVVSTLAARTVAPAAGASADTASLAAELRQLRDEVAAVKREFHAARAELESTAEQLRRELEQLNRQLGN